jgi:hypothetical protein
MANVAEMIDKTIRIFSLPSSDGNKGSSYRGFYLPACLLSKYGIVVSEENIQHPILLLGGTSIPISDREDLIGFLIESGYEVASLENPIGGLFDIGTNPAQERLVSLQSFIAHLKQDEHVKGIDIIAQSYSSFEVIRVLLSTPSYRSFVKSIILINPPGLNEHTSFTKHIYKFILKHVLKGYVKAASCLLGVNEKPLKTSIKKDRDYAKKEVRGITIWTLRSCTNIIRTLREVNDIVTFRIKDPLCTLKNEYNCNLNVFLQSEDQIIPAEVSKEQLKDILPEDNIRMVPGSHNDIFFQQWQRPAFLDFLKEIRQRKLS